MQNNRVFECSMLSFLQEEEEEEEAIINNLDIFFKFNTYDARVFLFKFFDVLFDGVKLIQQYRPERKKSFCNRASARLKYGNN